MRIAYWLGILVAALVCGSFAVSNRDLVSLALWPVPFAVALPLYLVVFAAVLGGFAAGAIVTWIGGRHRRRQLRSSRRRIGTLESELATARARKDEPRLSAKPTP